MDDPHVKPSLVDDPNFLAKLRELDDGLGRASRPPLHVRGERPANLAGVPGVPVAPPATAPGTEWGAFEPAQPVRAFEREFDTLSNPATNQGALPRAVGRRPLLDLFPPASLEPAPAGPIPGTAIGPRLPRRRHAPSREPVPASSGSTTYETFYGLTEPPFDASTDPKFLYSSTSHERVAQRLLTAVRRRDGCALVTGALGVGKTTACRAVIEKLDRRTLTSLLVDPFGSVEELLRAMLVDFGVISRDDPSRPPETRDALIATLRAFLASLETVKAAALVFIDEAQHIPVDVLRELPLLAAPFGAKGLLQIVLVGQPRLLALLRRRELRELDQCLTVRCTIEPLARDEVLGYVVHRLSVAGGSSRVEFDDEAVLRLHQFSGGVPRTINVICDRALTLGCGRSASVIGAELVETAADELGVTPSVSRSQLLVRGVVLAFALVVLALVGAAGALVMFPDPVARTVVQWTQVPRTPVGPLPDLPPELPPISAPVDAATSSTQPGNF